MTDAEITRRVMWLTRLLGVGGLVLIGVTWRLWTPQDVFPRVPLFWWAPPHWLDWTALGITLGGLLALVFSHRRIAATATACGFAILFLSDQHRLQPWAWQFFILATVIALGDDRTVFYGWRWLVVSIYFWSALSKFDVEFVNSIAPWILQPVYRIVPSWRIPQVWMTRLWDAAQWGALLMPITELAIAALLLCPRCRRWGLYGSWLMHIALICLLGPLGMNHSLGVVFWNAFSVFQNQFLFGGDCSESLSSTIFRKPLIANTTLWPARLVLGIVLIWPASEPWGYCDPWLGWAVYVPRFQKTEIWLNRDEAEKLPEDIAPFAKRPDDIFMSPEGTTVRVDLGHWSLSALGAPVYPHPRFVTACALELTGDCCHQDQLALFAKNRINRWNSGFWSDDRGFYQGREALEAYARTFRLNAFPESWYVRKSIP